MKLYPYIVSIILAFLSLIPPINFIIPNPNIETWSMIVVIAGFLGFLTLFIDTNIFVKIIAIGGFINCFFSCAPYICFTSYISLIISCYFFILCSKVKDWTPIYKTILCIIIYNLFIMAMQFIGKDALLNFGMGKKIVEHGIVGSRMEMESFLLICLSLLMAIKIRGQRIPVKVCKIMGLMILSFFLILCIYSDPIVHNPFICRIPVWDITIKMANQHPLVGWGIGSFKSVFFPLSGLHTFVWRQAHNDFLQILFETGYTGLVLILTALGFLIYKLRNNVTLIIGLGLICIDMSIHFPCRVANTVLILITFLAYCDQTRRPHGLSCQ